MRNKWLILVLTLVIGLALVAAGCLSSSKAPAGTQQQQQAKDTAGKKVIKFSQGYNEQHPQFLGAKKFKEIVEAKTNGRYDIQLYANAQLGDDVKATEAVRQGTLDMVGPANSPLAGMIKELAVLDLPFLFPSAEIADKVLDGPVGQKIAQAAEAKGLKILAYWENGYRQLTNNVREVKSPEDVKGLKIRTMENPIHLAAWKTLGANPTPMPFSEVFSAMQQKTIDGQENPIPTISLQKYNEVQKYCTLTGHVWGSLLFIISTKTWDSMSKEDQKIFQDAANEARDYQRKVNRQMDEELIGKLKAAGMTVTTLTPEQKKAFQDAVKPVYDQFADKIGKDLINQVVAEVEKASKK